MNILAWILFGIIVGLVASAVDPKPSRRLLVESMILGILGSLTGGFLGSIVFGIGISGFNFASFAVATLASLLLLIVGRAFSRA